MTKVVLADCLIYLLGSLSLEKGTDLFPRISSIKKSGAVCRSTRFEHNISPTGNASVLNRYPS